MSLRTRFTVPLSVLLLAFGSTAQAQIWHWGFTDRGVDYSLSFDSLVGNVGTYTLRLNTTGYNQHADPSFLDSVDIKAWAGTNISFTLLSAPNGAAAWTSSEGPISSGQVANTGCGAGESGFACVEAQTKGLFNVDNGSSYVFRFAVTANSFNLVNDGAHVGAGYASATGAGASYGITSVTAPIPEPETYAMLLAGLGLMGFVARRRQRNLSAT
jgi:PEP-CTERM motif-containing protein